MYGAKVPTIAGVSLLPVTGHSRPLFFAAVGLIVGGVVILVVAASLSRWARKSEAK